ncbi:hypothetical protein U1Q18_011781 [Sarracenia purpurea var. burkii]
MEGNSVSVLVVVSWVLSHLLTMIRMCFHGAPLLLKRLNANTTVMECNALVLVIPCALCLVMHCLVSVALLILLPWNANVVVMDRIANAAAVKECYCCCNFCLDAIHGDFTSTVAVMNPNAFAAATCQDFTIVIAIAQLLLLWPAAILQLLLVPGGSRCCILPRAPKRFGMD